MHSPEPVLPMLIFDSVSLAIILWVLFDTQRACRLLTFKRKTLAPWELWLLRGAGLFVVIGLARDLVLTLLHG